MSGEYSGPTTRSECWMGFSEALEDYLANREACRLVGAGRNREMFEQNMRIAARHMDILTQPPESEL